MGRIGVEYDPAQEHRLSPFAPPSARREPPRTILAWEDGPFLASAGETDVLERTEFQAPGPRPGGKAAPAPPAAPATIGFEFDLNVGLSRPVFTARAADMPAGSVFPPEHQEVTTHVGRDKADKVVDGFKVTRDGPRIEIATVPIAIDDNASFTAVLKNVVGFARELEAARKKVGADRAISVTGVSGHPVRFVHPRTAIAKLPLVIAARGSSARSAWPVDTDVWAAPQATITILLERVGDLVDAIAKSAKLGRGAALTGGPRQRLGVRSDIVVAAKRRVLADRARKLGTALSDKSKVTAADYTDRLAGLLILMTSYMLCGEMLDSNDYELFAKSYLPINVKAPFWQLFKLALSDRERLVFRELYVTKPESFYTLAKDGATAADAGKELFPPQVRGPDLDRFHAKRLTWGMLLDCTVKEKPLLVTKDNTVAKKKHAKGDEVLFAPLSSMIPFDRTTPRVALELRRIGFAAHPVRFFGPLMKTVRKLTQTLNP